MSLDRLLNEIDTRDVVALLSDLVSMPSYDSEKRIVEYISRRLDGIGVEYEITEVAPARQNLTASIGTGERSLILNTHMDTVPPGNVDNWRDPPLELTRDGNVLFGLGACDAKGSLTSMLTAFEVLALNTSLLDGRLILQAVCCEETHARGTLAEVARGVSADAAIIGEPNSLVPMIGHKGGLRASVTVFGKAAHGSAPHEGDNAISRMVGVIQALDGLAEDVSRRSDPLFGSASLAITQISGGQAPNVIPDGCTITVDRRLMPGETVGGALAEISAVIDNVREADPSLSVSIQKIIGIEPCRIPLEDAIVETVSKSVAQVNGGKPVISGFSACCDMWCLVQGASIPTMILGPGKTSTAHKANESITVDELYRAARMYAAIAVNWLGRK
jgi:acetylornithine deacetylase/succinyl-diaminopimelate desuccinylase family protein